MKVLPFTIPKYKRDSIQLQEDKGTLFYELLHQHEEFQISLILKGSGTLIVGDTISSFKENDIIVLGENLPHVFKSDLKKSENSHMISIFFTKNTFGESFFNTEELKPLTSFFNKTENGFIISKNTEKPGRIFKQLYKASKLDRFILFFQLLKELNKSTHKSLSSFVSLKKYSDNEGRRMSAVFEYTINNFQNEITLERISQQAAMTKNAFCKYFKKRTNKTYITFLNELRIEEACKLLQGNNEITIAEIAEMTGFQNISNFNRTFKQLIEKTPKEYKNQFN
ncbi:MAG: AraC-like DNA-binding protein [Flavobacteriaceae bacterium]|jgi:AraC-like DNA-binding protein